MGIYIIKLGGYWLEWSTLTDAPETFGRKLAEFKEYYRERYGEQAYQELGARLRRVEVQGVSAIENLTLKQLASGNRAGPDETELMVNEIYEAYCLRETVRGGWLPKMEEDDGQSQEAKA